MSTYIRISFRCFFAFSLFLVFAVGAQNPNSTKQPETVCVRISVDDPLGRYVTGLEKEYFRIYEDNVEQTIASFSQQDVPMSVGIIWDVSRSRNGGENFEGAKSTVSSLLRFRQPEDEYFLINFSESAKIQPITGKMLLTDVLIDKSKKRIALFDAIYMGLDRIKQSRYDKRALIIISDGEDNSSHHKPIEIRKFAMESDVQIYTIIEQGIMDPNEIRKIVNLTGGRGYCPNNFSGTEYYVDLIYRKLQNQYILSYSPTNKKHDGTWRKIKIKLDPPPKLPKLTVHARQVRYAPKN